ncbi:MAG TPA: DNA topoisomerase (ATP-hydrolyzing) [Vicinamibacteria bacterium]|nr:DNA topoisomerase (ATP-hydrolyzing) [Vicinamibacteria bacterium]
MAKKSARKTARTKRPAETAGKKSRGNNVEQGQLAFDDVLPPGGASFVPGGNGAVVELHETAQARYLNYALSVITSRALPDVRDGLKPVQRRILYTMWQQNITADAKFRKCAKVVGDVMGSYHPHGDAAIYDALVRIAQPFATRLPLVQGSGNFGSLDGDSPAAMRYTECRLSRACDEILGEIGKRTVPFRPNYDGSRAEPVVLPAKIPNLLVNGATGIAVGMATNIPPHNLDEVMTALIKMLDAQLEERELSSRQLCRWIKGPDFPTGGQVLNVAEELKQIYEEGSGTIRIRATVEPGETKRGVKSLYVTSIPYMVNKAQLVQRIADVVESRKMPLLVDVKDISTDDVRIELSLKADADEQKVLAYLYKNTPLQSNFSVNLTCLVPTENPEVGRPERLELSEILWHFLHFRMEVVVRRLEHELERLSKRIHILEGLEKVFDVLDQILRIVRRSDGKQDAAKKIMASFPLDAEQTDAILELKLYRLAKLEILLVRQELDEGRKRAKELRRLLGNEAERWKIVRRELVDIQQAYGKPDARRTVIAAVKDEPSFTADDFIVAEDNHVLVTTDGWVKRQREIKDPEKTRLREGDSVLACFAGSTRASAVFFSNLGSAYTARLIDLPATTGHGVPIQTLFKLKDGERIVSAFSLDPRVIGNVFVDEKRPDYAPETHAIAVSSDGYALRFGLEAFVEPSTRNGRRFARLVAAARIVGVQPIHGDETVIVATEKARTLLCRAEEVNYLEGSGRGTILIKLGKADRVLGFIAARDGEALTVVTSRGARKSISATRYDVTSRAGRGRELLRNGTLSGIVRPEVTGPPPIEGSEVETIH